MDGSVRQLHPGSLRTLMQMAVYLANQKTMRTEVIRCQGEIQRGLVDTCQRIDVRYDEVPRPLWKESLTKGFLSKPRACKDRHSSCDRV